MTPAEFQVIAAKLARLEDALTAEIGLARRRHRGYHKLDDLLKLTIAVHAAAQLFLDHPERAEAPSRSSANLRTSGSSADTYAFRWCPNERPG